MLYIYDYLQALEEGVSHLQQVAIKSKGGAVSRVKNIPVRVVSSTDDKSLSRLYQHRKSPMSWFRLPFVELVCFSCDDYDEYKRNFRLQLRAMADTESRLPTDPIPVFVYVQPPRLEDTKGPLRVVDAATRELADKHFPGNTVVHVAKNMFGIQDLVETIRAALFVSVEARCAAYHREASRILSSTIESPLTDDVSLSELYLVKDSAAALFEAVGMHQDAWMEYSELEAMMEEQFSRISSGERASNDEGMDIKISQHDLAQGEASQMWQRWHIHRSLVSRVSTYLNGTTYQCRAFIDLIAMPGIISNMVRLLMKDLKRDEALDTCRRFIDKHRRVLQEYERKKQCPPLLPEVWTFAACIGSVLLTCSGDGDLASGDMYFSKALEEKESGLGAHSHEEILHASQKHLQGLENSSKFPGFYCTAGQLLMEARDMLERLGKSYSHAPPSFSPAAPELLDLLQKGFLKAAPKTPQVMSSRHRLTPQNSLGAEDSPRFGMMSSQQPNELVRMARDNVLALDTIDLSTMEHQTPRSDDSDDRDNITARNISLHAREMSDSGTIADIAPGAVFHSAQNPDVGGQAHLENQSFLQTEASINSNDGKYSDMYMNIAVVESEPQVSPHPWMPQYWRLREITQNSSSFASIWVIITRSCRDLFAKGGYTRNACILNIGLGDAAYVGGEFQRAVEIYQEAFHEFQGTHWIHLLQSTSLKLACSQIQSNDIGIVETCNLLLGLACVEPDESTLGTVKVFADIFLAATSLYGDTLSASQPTESDFLILNPAMSLGIDGSIGMTIYEMDGKLSYAGEHDSCINAHVGDAVVVVAHVHNESGVPIRLDASTLSLVALQEMSNIEHPSPLANSSPMPITPSMQHNAFSSPTFSPTSPSDEVWKPRILSHWQDIDEVQGSCTVDGPLSIQPGLNEVAFCINPVRSGLYKLKHIQGRINGVDVQILPGREDHGCAGQRIILNVEPPAPRMFVKALTTGNHSLISGENQWLGIEIRVAREEISNAQLSIEWPSRNDLTPVEKSNDVAMEAEHIIKPLHSEAIVKSFLTDDDTLFAPPERNSDILGSGPSSMYSLKLENDSKLHVAVWWRVNVRHTDPVPEDVRIYSYKKRIRDSSPTKTQSVLPQRQNKQSQAVVEMPISLHYSDHCSRITSSSANISIDQPFQMQTDAYEIKKGLVVVSLKITSSMERRIQITGASMTCQKGFVLVQEHAGVSDILPCILDPLSSLSLSFMLRLEDDLLDNRAVAQAMVYRTGKLAPTIASLEYFLDGDMDDTSMLETYIMDEHIGEKASSLYSVYDRSMGPTYEDYKYVFSSRHGEDPRQKYVYQHKIAFQLSSIDTDSYNVFVSIRMLGPFTANIGCPVTLCWQLERVGSGSHSTGYSTISYEILADKNAWSKGSRGQGRISLGLRNGSVATIEAQWTPTSLGAVEVPALTLHDVYYQEIRETGVKKNLIIVKS